MIERLTAADAPAIHRVVNDAAEAYRGVIPADCWHEPYMPREELDAEIAAGVAFSGYRGDGELLGVMGMQHVADATLIRHAYVSRRSQRRGIGAALLEDLRGEAGERPLLVGTWADAWWAIAFYERQGFRRQTTDETQRLLRAYWRIPDRQAAVSVVLAAEGR